MIRLIKSFLYAFKGIFFQLQYERNFRIHCFAALTVVFLAARFYSFSSLEWGLLILEIALVFTAESINTALEQLANAVTIERNEKICHAKDASAGAVLCLAIGAVVLAYHLFWDVAIFKTIGLWLLKPLRLILALLYFAVALTLIFCRKTYKKDQ